VDSNHRSPPEIVRPSERFVQRSLGRSTDVFRRDREFDVSAVQGRLSTSSPGQCSTEPGLIAETWLWTTFPDAGPVVRIHFPPAESQQRTLRDVVHALMIGARCSVVEPAQLLQAVVVDPPRHAVDIMMKPPCVRMFMPNRISLVSISPVPLCQRGYRAHGVLCSLAPIRGFSSSSRTRNMPPAVSTFALTHHRATNALASVASAK